MSPANPSEPQQWEVRLSNRARHDLENAVAFLSETRDKSFVDQWEDGIEEVIGSLATFPERGALAQETILFAPPPLRHLVYRKARHGSAYQIFYRLYESPDDPPTV